MKIREKQRSSRFIKISKSLSWDVEQLYQLQQVADAQTNGNLSHLVNKICEEYLNNQNLNKNGVVVNDIRETLNKMLQEVKS